MNDGDVVTVMAVTGEYVGKLVRMDETGVVLQDPRFVSVSEQGMGFANGIAMTGVKDPKEMTILQAVFVCETNPEVESAYRQSVSGLITAPAGKLQI
jgi:catalase (peroxidase I)